MKTREEAIAECVAFGWPRAYCEPEIDATMVDGVYCEGTVVITADGRRCVSPELAARAARLRQAPPVNKVAAPEKASPWPAVALGVAAIAGLAFAIWISRPMKG